MDYAKRLNKCEWEVRPFSLEVGRALVERYHYMHGGSNTRTYLHGLFRRGALFDWDCLGLVWWLPAMVSTAQKMLPENPGGVLCLSRLVVLPDVPKNAATYLIGRSVRLIDRERWPVLVSYADEWQGHTGQVYKAAGWHCGGKTRPKAVYTLAGRVVSTKAGKRTWRHSEMLAMGCELVGYFPKYFYYLVPGSACRWRRICHQQTKGVAHETIS